MGVLGALYFTPEELETELNWIDEHVDGKPYGVDVVMPASYEGADFAPEELVGRLQGMIPEGHRKFVDDLLAKHGSGRVGERRRAGAARLDRRHRAAPGRDGAQAPDRAARQRARPPPADVVELAHAKGVKVAALASTPATRSSRSRSGSTSWWRRAPRRAGTPARSPRWC